jgi:hypothetical protein
MSRASAAHLIDLDAPIEQASFVLLPTWATAEDAANARAFVAEARAGIVARGWAIVREDAGAVVFRATPRQLLAGGFSADALAEALVGTLDLQGVFYREYCYFATLRAVRVALGLRPVRREDWD